MFPGLCQEEARIIETIAPGAFGPSVRFGAERCIKSRDVFGHEASHPAWSIIGSLQVTWLTDAGGPSS